MAKIRNVILPHELNEALVRVVEHIPDPYLVDWGKKLLPGGFTKAESIRGRLNGMLRGAGVIEPWLLAMMRTLAPCVEVVGALSHEGLHELFESLAVLGSRADVVLALLIDAREDVHKLGAEKLAQGLTHPPEIDKTTATARLTEFANDRLLVAAGRTVDAPGAAAKEGPRATRTEADDPASAQMVKDLTQSLSAANDTIRRLKENLQEQGSKQKTKLEIIARNARDDKKHVLTERDQIRSKLVRVLKERDELAARLAGLVAQQEKEREALAARASELAAQQQTAITQAIENETSMLVRKWISAPLETEKHLERLKGKTGDLLARTEQALQTQAQQDRFTGNRVELEQKLAQLRQAHERLTRAAQTAICPVAQVKEVLADVENEVARTEKLLAGNRSTDPLTEKVLVAINHAASWNEAKHYSELLGHLVDSGLVPREDRRRLYDAIQRKLSLLMEQNRSRGGEAPDTGWSLRDAIFRNRPSLLILDGHNLLFGLEDIFRPHYDPDGHPGRHARDQLVTIVRRLVESRPNLHARICFDAPHRETLVVSPNIEIEFSGGKGEHRADRRIGAHVAGRKPEEVDQKWFVVTDDRAVRRQAVKNGAQYVPGDLFAVLLNDFRCLSDTAEKAA